MILRATGALGRPCRLELDDDLVDCRCSAFDWMRDRAAAKRTKTFPVSGEIHFRDWNVFPLDVALDMHLGQVKQRLHPHVFAFRRYGDELAQVFGSLIYVVLFELRFT